MYFHGAQEWFFWLGVEAGLNAKFLFEGDDIPIYTANNKTTKACKDAFRWGFSFGAILTFEEYTDLTTWPKADTIIPEVIDEVFGFVPVEVNESNFPIVGNC